MCVCVGGNCDVWGVYCDVCVCVWGYIVMCVCGGGVYCDVCVCGGGVYCDVENACYSYLISGFEY